jgi:ribonuclease HII
LSEEIVGGVDEAGRGSLIGPMVVAGVSVRSSKLMFLQESKVKDSKLLLPTTRRRLYDIIAENAEMVTVIEVSPKKIDEYVKCGKKLHKLNYLEVITMAKIIEALDVRAVYVDCPDVKPARYASDLLSLSCVKPRIISEHHADRNYVVVSAASIIAKVTRDRKIDELAKEYGFFGSGYPSDLRTVEFVRNWIETKGNLPDFVRQSWKSLRKIRSKTLDEY